MTDAEIAAGQPAPDRLAELEELLGRDMLRAQVALLATQLAELIDASPALPGGDLEQEAHRVAGAADMLGFCDIGAALRLCQQRAAAGDLAAARAQIALVAPMAQGLADFLNGY